MCMMKNSGEKEACEVANNLAALDGRVTKVEERMNKIEGSLNDGFKSLSVSISNLGHDVGSRVNLIEKKVVDEKQEWGKSFRRWLDWIVKLLILGCGCRYGRERDSEFREGTLFVVRKVVNDKIVKKETGYA